MSQININHLITINDNIPGIQSVSFDYVGKKIYSASKIDRITGVFTSDIIEATESFIRWDTIDWSGISTDRNIAFFVRNGETSSSILTEKWIGPFYDSSFSISSLNQPYIQFMVALTADDTTNPLIDSIFVKFISSQDSVKFFTRLFNLGFSPKTILLTYNAEETTDSVVRFAVSVQDTTDTNKYQFIEPNKIVDLLNLSPLASSIKLMIEIAGNSGVPVEIHEVAFEVGGYGAARVNKGTWEEGSSSSSG